MEPDLVATTYYLYYLHYVYPNLQKTRARFQACL